MLGSKEPSLQPVSLQILLGVLEMLAPDRLDAGWLDGWMVDGAVDGPDTVTRTTVAHRSISPQAGVDWIGVRYTSHQPREEF